AARPASGPWPGSSPSGCPQPRRMDRGRLRRAPLAECRAGGAASRLRGGRPCRA
ncbi:unnamed protein product, partial [Polarella glacialis]